MINRLIRAWFLGVPVGNNRFNEIDDYGESRTEKHYDTIAPERAPIAKLDLPTR